MLAFEANSRVVELEEDGDGNPFVCDAPTVDVCAMAGGTILQAHPQVGTFEYHRGRGGIGGGWDGEGWGRGEGRIY